MLAFLLAAPVLASTLAAIPAPLVDLRADDDIASDLDAIRLKHGIPGIAGAIVTVDGIELAASGVRRAGRDERVRAEDLWHLGSCTKAMNATVAARLVEKGRISWTTTVGEAFPEVSMHESWKPVTLEQLLSNRGGAPANLDRDGLWGTLWGFDGAPADSRRLLLEGVVKHPTEYEPGTKNVYSNAGFAIAGHMCETRAGIAWEELARREVFEPLGITSAGFGAPEDGPRADQEAERAMDLALQPRGHNAQGKPVEPGPGSDNPVAIAPAGRAHMSIEDWGRFVRAHLRAAAGLEVLDDQGRPFLSPESWTKLHTPAGADAGDGYALGWGVATRPWAKGGSGHGRVLTHSGSNTMWFCVAWLAPERGFAVIVTTNSGAAAPGADEACGALIKRHLAK